MSFESKSESSSDKSFPCNIPCAIPIDKVDASTSCDLTPCNEDVIVETCDDLIAKENDELNCFPLMAYVVHSISCNLISLILVVKMLLISIACLWCHD